MNELLIVSAALQAISLLVLNDLRARITRLEDQFFKRPARSGAHQPG